MDPDTNDGNVQAFKDTFGEKILKFLNQRRTDAQGGLKKAYLERARQDPKPLMPDIARMQEVILRQNFICGETHTKTGDIITEEYAAQQQELFVWYVDCLLICVCGNHRWGYSIKNYNEVSTGKWPGSATEKYVNSSDEAMVLLMYLSLIHI